MKGSGLGCSLHAGAPGPSAAYPDYPHCMDKEYFIRRCEGEHGMHALMHVAAASVVRGYRSLLDLSCRRPVGSVVLPVAF